MTKLYRSANLPSQKLKGWAGRLLINRGNQDRAENVEIQNATCESSDLEAEVSQGQENIPWGQKHIPAKIM